MKGLAELRGLEQGLLEAMEIDASGLDGDGAEVP